MAWPTTIFRLMINELKTISTIGIGMINGTNNEE